MITEKPKAVSYARVSSTEQEKEGFSIPAQQDLLREFAEKNNIEIVQEYSEAETAKDVGRHKFKEMLQYLKKHKDVNTIIAEKTDRLYRNFYDYIDLDVDKTGYTVCLVKERVILTSKSSSHEKMVHGFKVLVAKTFIDNLREETQKAERRKLKQVIL